MNAARQPARPVLLYRYALSGHSHRVELFLSLLGLPYELRELDLARGEHKTPDFLALNPFGQVPVIDDDGVVVADSNAILVYLALHYAKPDWLPTEPVAAAEVQRWLSVAAGPLAYGAARARVIELFRLKEDTAAPIAQGHRLFTLMERTLAARPFLAGALPTIADVSLYAYTAHAPEGGVSLADYLALRAWLARIEALPGFVAMRASAIGLLAA